MAITKTAHSKQTMDYHLFVCSTLASSAFNRNYNIPSKVYVLESISLSYVQNMIEITILTSCLDKLYLVAS